MALNLAWPVFVCAWGGVVNKGVMWCAYMCFLLHRWAYAAGLIRQGALSYGRPGLDLSVQYKAHRALAF